MQHKAMNAGLTTHLSPLASLKMLVAEDKAFEGQAFISEDREQDPAR